MNDTLSRECLVKSSRILLHHSCKDADLPDCQCQCPGPSGISRIGPLRDKGKNRCLLCFGVSFVDPSKRLFSIPQNIYVGYTINSGNSIAAEVVQSKLSK